MKYIILVSFICLVGISCWNNQPIKEHVINSQISVHKESTIVLLDSLIHYDKDKCLRVFVEKDSINNIFINVYDKQNYLYDATGVSFSSLICDEGCLRALKLYDGPYQQYILNTYDLGSTYGKQNLYIIWYDESVWNITKSNFSHAFLEDRNQDGFFEIVEYYNGIDSLGEVYSFDNGNFIKKSMNQK